MSSVSQGAAVLDGGPDDFEFEADDVTGVQQMKVSLSSREGDGLPITAPAWSVARALAVRMRLPTDVPWALRSGETGAFLDESRPIVEQIPRHSRLTLTPKAHLGSWA
jgi:hypothetical protein